mmetsp:Transcript_17970/g.25399  ORF Transcript_17970/g.25399 Transcript_17970/m.25399 type:complete len:208 (-) Transcript_17970:144-767(-)|eukprot:CAMPEP_0184857134 /NCGR_PEP_ID=MMETSP0580-20130426/2295_1 /TAXON_ID=1118495 /ORGANISM="Dactyliosolen fragilissimus" /LENGTH=207 /DNA_ID=CAMNT_0027352549 /DNA_START=656 /DNA_END=1282 /DNA_ORIENTATION=-
MTVEICKDIMMGLRSKLCNFQKRYKLWGNGTGQIGVDERNAGTLDADLEFETFMDGSDLSKFLRNPKEMHLLYWYFHLCDYGLLKFTCKILPSTMVATSDMCNSVSASKKRKLNWFEEQEEREAMNSQRHAVTTELKRMAKEMLSINFFNLTEKKDGFEGRKMKLELSILRLDEHEDKVEISIMKHRLTKPQNSIEDIDERIEEIKK